MDTQHVLEIVSEESELYLQTPEGQQYGPARLDLVQEWCREGRITPDQMASLNAEEWTPVTEIPALGFDWLAVLPDGTEAGPFHLAVLEEQAREGNMPEGTLFKHKQTGETQQPSLPAATGETDTSRRSLALDGDQSNDNNDPAQEGTCPVHKDEPEREMTTDDSAQKKIKLLTIERRNAGNNSPSKPGVDQAAATSTMQNLRQENTLLQDQTQYLQDQLQTAETERQAAETALLDMQNQVSQNETELDNLRSQLAQLQEHYEQLQQENQHQFEQLDDVRASALTAEQSWKREITVLQARLDDKVRLLDEISELVARHGHQTLHALQPPAQHAAGEQSKAVTTPPAVSTQPVPPPQPASAHQTFATMPAAPPGIPRQRSPMFRYIPFITCLAVVIFGIHAWLSNIAPEHESRAAPIERASQTDVVPPSRAYNPSNLPDTDESLVLQPERSNREPRPQAPAAQITWPVIDLPGSSITREGNTIRIVFHDGLFTAGKALSNESRELLLRLAQQLQPHMHTFSVMIEGHTDATPVRRENTQFVNNFSLGLMRAEAAKDLLSQQGGLPANRIHTASAGQASPPYPNDTSENRARNRTVVITVNPLAE
jgi:flagellar motor protein MotB